MDGKRKRFSWSAEEQDEKPSSSKRQATSSGATTKAPLRVATLGLGMIREPLEVRVTYASCTRQSRDGKCWIHNFYGIDRDSSELSFTSFADKALTLGNVVQTNQVYSIKDFEVKISNAGFKKCGNLFEAYLKTFSSVTDLGDVADFPPVSFNFKTINEALNMPNDDPVDILGVLVDDLECEGQGKRELVLTDKSKQLMSVFLFGEVANNWAVVTNIEVLAIRNAVVMTSLDGKKHLRQSTLAGTSIFKNQCSDEAIDLLEWFTNEPKPVQETAEDLN